MIGLDPLVSVTPAVGEGLEAAGTADVIDLRAPVPTPYGGRLDDLESMRLHWYLAGGGTD